MHCSRPKVFGKVAGGVGMSLDVLEVITSAVCCVAQVGGIGTQGEAVGRYCIVGEAAGITAGSEKVAGDVVSAELENGVEVVVNAGLDTIVASLNTAASEMTAEFETTRVCAESAAGFAVLRGLVVALETVDESTRLLDTVPKTVLMMLDPPDGNGLIMIGAVSSLELVGCTLAAVEPAVSVISVVVTGITVIIVVRSGKPTTGIVE